MAACTISRTRQSRSDHLNVKEKVFLSNHPVTQSDFRDNLQDIIYSAMALKSKFTIIKSLELNSIFLNSVKLTYCNMTKAGNQSEMTIGDVQMKPRKTMKVVLKIHSGSVLSSNADIPVADVPVNDFNSFVNNTFTVPFSGSYKIRANIKQNACFKTVSYSDDNGYHGVHDKHRNEPAVCYIKGLVNNMKSFNVQMAAS